MSNVGGCDAWLRVLGGGGVSITLSKTLGGAMSSRAWRVGGSSSRMLANCSGQEVNKLGIVVANYAQRLGGVGKPVRSL